MAEPVIKDIKRHTEIYICERLREQVTGHLFVPFTGGGDTEDAAVMEPPFTVVVVTEAESMFCQESTWKVEGTVQVITNSGEATSAEHSTLVRSIYKALGTIVPNSADPLFSLHGLNIMKMRSADDDALSVHSDIFEFVAGVGG